MLDPRHFASKIDVHVYQPLWSRIKLYCVDNWSSIISRSIDPNCRLHLLSWCNCLNSYIRFISKFIVKQPQVHIYGSWIRFVEKYHLNFVLFEILCYKWLHTRYIWKIKFVTVVTYVFLLMCAFICRYRMYSDWNTHTLLKQCGHVLLFIISEIMSVRNTSVKK